MTEIEKMYENAGIKKIELDYPDNIDPFYPDFTAEKQLKLIKWLGKRPLTLLIGQYKGKYYFGNSNFNSKADSFDNAIAIRINDLWQDLTDQEKEEIRGVLNGRD